jgi:hypothetical protein
MLRPVVTDPLAAQIDVPRQTGRWFAADDLIQRIILIVGDRDANLDGPMIVGSLRGDFSLRLPRRDPGRSALPMD